MLNSENRLIRCKRSALYISVKHEICDHQHIHWSGRMPCTGIRHCSMCGMIFDSKEHELDAIAIARAAIEDPNNPAWKDHVTAEKDWIREIYGEPKPKTLS